MNRTNATVAAAIMVALAASNGMAQSQPAAPKPAATAQPAPQAASPKPAVPAQPAPQPPAPRVARPPAASAARGAITLVVTDTAGKTLPDVRVSLSGPLSREGATSSSGYLTFEGLRPGTYRVRLEGTDLVTFEREVTVKAGPAVEVDVALSRAAAKPPEPPPAPAQNCRTAIPADPNATASFTELPPWIDRNLIGRNDAPREDPVGGAPALGASVLQVGNPTPQRARSDADEVIYVIAGEGALITSGRTESIRSGSLAVVPRGVAYTLERRSRGPLVVLSVASK
jgi:mannose-6-phosphate isomerase-like protein (cupin superfamily)